MKDYLLKHPWKIIEDSFHPQHNKITESIMSIGNGYMGQRANFEEKYSGETMQGSYLAGIYYPDKTRVGWWKNGYPEYFAKVLNNVNWIGIDVIIDGEALDWEKVKITEFHRELDMQHSILRKQIKFITAENSKFTIESERFCSWTRKELGIISYKCYSDNFNGTIEIRSLLDFDVYNEDSNYDEQFWNHQAEGYEGPTAYVQAVTKKTNFEVRAAMRDKFDSDQEYKMSEIEQAKKAGYSYKMQCSGSCRFELTKKVIIVSSFYTESSKLGKYSHELLDAVDGISYQSLKKEHAEAWEQIWHNSDILINGDVAAQQGIRFNIFHLHQTYSGDDARLNIGPKGFTGEKYGGSTYWDTEAYCLPFYLGNSDQQVARNLLLYRYKHLRKAIENAEKLGFHSGAALYPKVTMNGEECHNEWEITFEEIHRNGAIAYAIYDYTVYTGDESYLYEDGGLEVLVGIARFWRQRVNWSEDKKAFVMLGVTGPNEYENNVNNNWYTNYIAVWCLKYTIESLQNLESRDANAYRDLLKKLNLNSEELNSWHELVDNMYFPYDREKQLVLQQDGFLDKELIPVNALDAKHRPLNQNWSWDRILRSCYIKQADVLQGMYFFENDFDLDTIRRHFKFYEPLTVHESSLSPCVHSILACRIGEFEKAYEMYLRTARLDLDDYNNDTEDGLHITSMAGTWMSIVKGFAGMKLEAEKLEFNPYLPEQWDAYSFKIRFRSNIIQLKVEKSTILISNFQGDAITLTISGKAIDVPASGSIAVNRK